MIYLRRVFAAIGILLALAVFTPPFVALWRLGVAYRDLNQAKMRWLETWLRVERARE
jgi:hypothetical protein